MSANTQLPEGLSLTVVRKDEESNDLSWQLTQKEIKAPKSARKGQMQYFPEVTKDNLDSFLALLS